MAVGVEGIACPRDKKMKSGLKSGVLCSQVDATEDCRCIGAVQLLPAALPPLAEALGKSVTPDPGAV